LWANPNGYGGNGGTGIASAISGTLTIYGGGGGGGGNTNGGAGGAGGGGAGAASSGSAGSTNTGGGGGGGHNTGGASGGSGIVIIRYPDIYKDAVSTTNGTKTTYTGYKVYTFLSSGSIMF
jgi:hypothetical protein